MARPQLDTVVTGLRIHSQAELSTALLLRRPVLSAACWGGGCGGGARLLPGKELAAHYIHKQLKLPQEVYSKYWKFPLGKKKSPRIGSAV
jgi:hypothetical protein